MMARRAAAASRTMDVPHAVWVSAEDRMEARLIVRSRRAFGDVAVLTARIHNAEKTVSILKYFFHSPRNILL